MVTPLGIPASPSGKAGGRKDAEFGNLVDLIHDMPETIEPLIGSVALVSAACAPSTPPNPTHHHGPGHDPLGEEKVACSACLLPPLCAG